MSTLICWLLNASALYRLNFAHCVVLKQPAYCTTPILSAKTLLTVRSREHVLIETTNKRDCAQQVLQLSQLDRRVKPGFSLVSIVVYC